MAVVGFNFTKMIGEKNADPTKKLNIDRSVNIQSVEETHLNVGTQKQQAMVVSFVYAVTYAPGLRKVELQGNLLYIAPEEKLVDAIAYWKKNSTLPVDVMNPVLHSVFTRCNIQALIMSRDLALPPPFALPSPKIR